MQMTSIDRREETIQLDATVEESKLLLEPDRNEWKSDAVQSFARSELNIISGVCKEGDTNMFAKLLYRASHGKVISYFENIGTGIGSQLESNQE